jgi:putative phage-type endonuclease
MQVIDLERTKFIGGSDCAALLGLSPWMSPLMLYQKKTGEYVEDITPAKQKMFDRGHRWEPIVVSMLVDELKERGHDVEIIARNQRYQDPQYPFLAAEIDLELRVDGLDVNGEAKTVSPYALKEWGDEDGDGDIPVYYAAQVQHGMMIRPRSRTIVAALTGFDDKPRIHWVDRDDEVIAGIRQRELEFWNRVQTRTPPDPTNLLDVIRLMRNFNGVPVEATPAIAEAAAQLKTLKGNKKAMDGDEEDLKFKISSFLFQNLKEVKGASLEDKTALVYQGKTLLTWTTQSTTRLDTKTIKEEAPELYDRYSTNTQSRVLRIK